MNTEQAQIQFLGLKVRESHIVFNEEAEYSLDINVQASGSISTSAYLFILTLVLTVRDNDGKLEIEVITDSAFSYPEDADLEVFKNGYFVFNAPAIVFPYIRAYISSLTALSGMETLTLPTLNLSKIGESLKGNIQTVD